MYRVGSLRGSRRAGDLCAAASAAVRQGPRGVLPAFLATLLLASGAAVLILSVVPADGPQPALNEWVRGSAAGLGAVAGILLLVHARSPRTRDRLEARASDPGLTTLLLSLAVLVVLLLVPVYLLAARTHPPAEQWLGYGFFDKRWLVATFLLGTVGALVVLAAMARIVQAASAAPSSWRDWLRESLPAPSAAGLGLTVPAISRVRLFGSLAAALALGAYFFAPPWHVALSEVDVHETPMMAGVQAIAHGATPYIDSAAVQYGPGSELIHYLYLEAGGFDLEGLRQSTVLLYLLGATIFFATILLRLPLRLALISCLLAILVFPALQMVSFGPDGAVDADLGRIIEDAGDGVWGWPNAMRYVGVFALAMLFPAITAIAHRRRAIAAGLALGALWGVTSFVSQENLLGGAIAVGALASLLFLTETVSPRALLNALIRIGLGFAAVAAAVLGYYAANGELFRFLELYFLIPSAVSAGYSNTPFLDDFSPEWAPMYYVLPFLLGALCLLSILRLHPIRVARDWSHQRVLLVSVLVAACVAHTGSLLRADPSHLINAMLVLPVAVVLTVAYLPGLLGVESQGRRRLAAVALAVIPLALLPLGQITNAPDRLQWPLARFSHQSEALQWQRADPDSVAATRLTSDILARPGQRCCSYARRPLSMREFAAILNRLHGVIGERRVYVANFIDDLHPGAAYFLADLRPAPILFEPTTMAMNERLLGDFLGFFQDHISEVEAVAAVYPRLPEFEMFRRAYPDYRETRIRYSYGQITVLTR